MITKHSTYKGAIIWNKLPAYGINHYLAELEDGVFTYSILEFRGQTIKEVKEKINTYFKRVSNLYKQA